jgi:hypothetical protein
MSAAGLVVPFLPFAYGVSPLAVVGALPRILTSPRSNDWMFALLGVPFFLVFPLCAMGVPVVWRRVPRILRSVAMWTVSLIGIFTTATFQVRLWQEWFPNPTFSWEVLIMAIFPAMLFIGLIAGALLLWKRLHRPAGIMFMLTAYTANGLFCLVGFWDHREIGWYLTVPVTAGYLIEMLRLILRDVLGQRARFSLKG